MNVPVFDRLIGLLNRLDDAKIHHTLRHSRYDAIMITANVPGERWEIEFLLDGDVDVEVFRSNGEIHEEAQIETLIALHSFDAPESATLTNPTNGPVLTK